MDSPNLPKNSKVINKLRSQKETIKMAKYFSRGGNLSLLEKILGLISAVIIYGGGLVFLMYMLSIY